MVIDDSHGRDKGALRKIAKIECLFIKLLLKIIIDNYLKFVVTNYYLYILIREVIRFVYKFTPPPPQQLLTFSSRLNPEIKFSKSEYGDENVQESEQILNNFFINYVLKKLTSTLN